MAGHENVILMGDFNFGPDTEQYQLTTETLDDSWTVLWPEVDKHSADPLSKAIDHIFVSRGTGVAMAEYLPFPESDHPAVAIDIAW